MAKFKCLCGFLMSNCLCPGDTEGYIISESQVCHVDEWDYADIVENCFNVWECHSCGTLAISRPGESKVNYYEPRKRGNLGIMKIRDIKEAT